MVRTKKWYFVFRPFISKLMMECVTTRKTDVVLNEYIWLIRSAFKSFQLIVHVDLGEVNLLREKMILDIEVFEDDLQLKEQFCDSDVPISIVLMVDGMLNT